MMQIHKVAGLFVILCLSPLSSAAAGELEFMYQKDGVNYFITADGRELAQHRAIGVLSDTPDYDWWHGCSPTSVGMIVGYYDRNGYGGQCYTYLVPGGEAELSNYGYPEALANDAIASPEHITDYWPDPDTGTHAPNSLADFMGTNQDHIGDPCGYPGLGGTYFYNWTDGSPFTPADAEANGVENCDGMYGVGEYLQYQGYNYTSLFSQYINPLNSNGFTLAQYQSEIDEGRPMVIQVSGHSMFGYGYSGSTVYVHDTWSEGAHTFAWGTSYSGLNHYGVMPLTVTDGEPCGGWNSCYRDTNYSPELQISIEENVIRGQAVLPGNPVFPAPITGIVYNGKALFAINYLGASGLRFYEINTFTGTGTTWGVSESGEYYDSGRKAQFVGCSGLLDKSESEVESGAMDETFVGPLESGDFEPSVAGWDRCYVASDLPNEHLEVNMEGARIRGENTFYEDPLYAPITGFMHGGRTFLAIGYYNDNLRFYEVSSATGAGTGWAILGADSNFYHTPHSITFSACPPGPPLDEGGPYGAGD